MYSINSPSIKSIEPINPNYELALLTYYTAINNRLNEMTGDLSTLNNIKNMVDKEMIKIVNMLNCRVLTIDDNVGRCSE